MNISTVRPTPPPCEYRLTFSRHEGWAIVAALAAYAAEHPGAADTNEWKKWANDLDRRLRQD